MEFKIPMRCFIAIDLPESVKSCIIEKITHIKNENPAYNLRITKKENLHVTLAFLGEIDEDELPGILKGVSSVAEKYQGFDCTLAKIAAVPEKFPRMIWITLDKSSEMSMIYEDLKKRVILEKEHGGFKAHITAARIRPDTGAKTAISIDKSEYKIEPIKFRVIEIKIMKSTLKNEGPEYGVIKAIPLEQKQRERA